MASGDYMNLTFRNTTTYQPDGSFIPDGYIFTVSTNGRQNWTNSLRLDTLTVSTFTLNSTFIVASTNTNNMVVFSTLTVSSTDSRNMTYSTLRGDSIITNNLTLNSNLNVGSTFASLVQTSTLKGSTFETLNGSISTLTTAQIGTSSIRTGAFSTQNAIVQSTLTTSTLNVDNTTGRLASYDTVNASTQQVSSLLTTSSLFVPGAVIYSTLSGSTAVTNYATIRSTLSISTLLGSTVAISTLTGTQAEVVQLSVLSTAMVSTAFLQFANVSSLLGSTIIARSIGFSTMLGSTLTLNTVIINSTLTTSSFATGSLNFSTLVGSTVTASGATVNSTLTVSTTETLTMVVNRQPGTSPNPTYKVLIDQGQGQNENALYIGNSNYNSDQGLSIGMVNEGFSYFGTYAKIQGKRSGSAGTTNVVLQSDAGKVGIGTTNPDALVDIYAPSGTPGTLFLYNGASGTNNTGTDLTVAAFNMGSSGSGLYYDSIRIRVPNGATTSASRMDFCTPASVSDNTQTTRVSVLPYTGYVGIATTTPGNLLTVYGAGYGLVHTNGTVDVGSYTTALMGLLGTKSNHPLSFFTNSITSTPTMTIATSGNVGIATTTPGNLLTVYGAGYGLIHTNGTVEVGSHTTSLMGLLGTKSNHALSFFTNSLTGTPQMTLLTSGYVGIGTTVPTNLLHIYSGSTNLAAIRLTSGSTGWGSGMVFENTTVTTGRSYGLYSDGASGTFRVHDVTASLDRMVIDSAGKVGIGTTAPYTLLHATGSSTGKIAGLISNTNTEVDSSAVLQFGLWNTSGLGIGTSGPAAEIAAICRNATQGNTDLAFSTYTGNAITPNSTLVERMRITASGDVGIGTSAPGQRMTILGLQAMNGNGAAVTPELIYGGIRPGTTGVQNGTSFALGLCGSTTAIDPYGRLDFLVNGLPATGNSWGYTPDVRVLSVIGDGKVGIGTTAPIDTMDVNGALRVVNRTILPSRNQTGGTLYPGLVNLGGGYGPQIRSVYPDTAYTDNISLQLCTNQGSNDSTLVPRIHIAAQSGNVGIGTTNPVFPTSMIYSGSNDMTQTPALNFGLQIHNTIGSTNNNRSNLILFTDSNSTQAAIGGYRHAWASNYVGGLLFMVGSQPTGYNAGTPTNTTQAAASLTEAMRITYNGAVGIGITNPGALLHVNGNVNMGAWLSMQGGSSCYIRVTSHDGYTPNSYNNNLIIRSWYGIGFADHTDTVRIAMDTRTGNAQFNGTLTCGTLNATNINVIPTGIITLWYGNTSNVPTGWALCNGGNGTPDLRDRFIVGAGNSYTAGNTGGIASMTLTVSQIPAHSHRQVTTANCGQGGPGIRTTYTGDCGGAIAYDMGANTWETGGNQPFDNRPPYYALCYIMKL